MINMLWIKIENELLNVDKIESIRLAENLIGIDYGMNKSEVVRFGTNEEAEKKFKALQTELYFGNRKEDCVIVLK